MRGFTLAEMLVVIAVSTIVAGTLMSVIVSFYRNNAYVFEAAVAVDSARKGIGFAVQDLREATYGDDGSYPIESAATSSVTFYSDVDADGGVERVRIYIYDEVLYRVVTNATNSPPTYSGQTGATTTIVSYVRNGTTTPLFTYVDSEGTALPQQGTDVSEIAAVTVTLMVDVNPTRAPSVLTFSNTATLRNLLTQ